VPQEYPLGVVTNIVRDLGGILTTKQKGDSVLATIPARTNGAGCVQHPSWQFPVVDPFPLCCCPNTLPFGVFSPYRTEI